MDSHSVWEVQRQVLEIPRPKTRPQELRLPRKVRPEQRSWVRCLKQESGLVQPHWPQAALSRLRAYSRAALPAWHLTM